MTREQRLVTLAFLAFALIVGLAIAGHVTATAPSHLGHISERLFADAAPAAPASRAGSSVGSTLGREGGLPGAPDTRADAPLLPSAPAGGGPTSLTGDAAPVVGQPATAEPSLAASRPTARPQQSGPPPAPVLPGRQRSGVATYATWYDDGSGYYAAVGDWHWGDDPYNVVVCTAIAGTSRCVTVTVRDACTACMDGSPLLDLSPMAFRALGVPLSAGVVRVTVYRP